MKFQTKRRIIYHPNTLGAGDYQIPTHTFSFTFPKERLQQFQSFIRHLPQSTTK
jgi:hypothetical protein